MFSAIVYVVLVVFLSMLFYFKNVALKEGRFFREKIFSFLMFAALAGALYLVGLYHQWW
jgi:uncharacterized membrane protein